MPGLPGACKSKNAKFCFKKAKFWILLYELLLTLKKANCLISYQKCRGQPVKRAKLLFGLKKANMATLQYA